MAEHIFSNAAEFIDSNRIHTALKFIKDVCVNVAGNLVASGIVHQISSLLP